MNVRQLIKFYETENFGDLKKCLAIWHCHEFVYYNLFQLTWAKRNIYYRLTTLIVQDQHIMLFRHITINLSVSSFAEMFQMS